MRSLLLALPLHLAPPALAADTARIHLLDGTSAEGTALIPRGDRLEVAAEKGPSRILPLADVLEAFPAAPAALRPEATPLPGASPAAPDVLVQMTDGDRIRGLLLRGAGEAGFVLRTPALGEIEVSLERVASLLLVAAHAKSPDPPAMVAGEKGDRFFFASGDRVDGTLRSVAPAGLRVRTAAGEDRTLPLDGLLGCALLPLAGKPEEGLRVRVALAEGSLVSGRTLADAGESWLLGGMGDGKDRPLPLAAVVGLSVRGGKGTPLPDLAPASVEVKPYWGDDPAVEGFRPVRDRAFTLEPGPAPPLLAGGRPFLRGLSMFSGTTATYDLAGRGFRRFVASVAVDDGGPKGAVEFEILVDGKSAWRSPVVRAGAPPLEAPAVDLSSAKTLALVVHAGPGDDVQDYADWLRAAFLP